MKKFRKKPVVIEATQFVPGEPHEGVCFLTYRGCLAETHVHTANGPVCIDAGDWLIPEPNGTGFYPCKPDAFAALYEPVDEAAEAAAERGGRAIRDEWFRRAGGTRGTLTGGANQ